MGPGAQKKAPAGRWGLTAAGKAWAARTEEKPLSADDPNDEFCRICLQGVSPAWNLESALYYSLSLLSS